MKNTKIKLDSNSLKVGDIIIRTKGLYSTTPIKIVAKNSTHVKAEYANGGEQFIIPIETYNEDWVRYNLD